MLLGDTAVVTGTCAECSVLRNYERIINRMCYGFKSFFLLDKDSAYRLIKE